MASHSVSSSSSSRRRGPVKQFLRSSPLTAPLYAAVRGAYVLWHTHWSRPLGAWLAWRARKSGYKTFRWNGLVVRERWNDPYALHALRGDLDMFDGMRRAVEIFGPPHPVVLDVGANIGLFSMACAPIDGATVYGFEPVRDTFANFEHNVRSNGLGNVRPLNIGLSDRPGRMWIGPPVATADSPSYSVHPDGPVDRTIGEEAEFSTLDDFVHDEGLERVDFLKVDAEGHDFQVLAGGAATIRRFRPVIQLEYETSVLDRQSGARELIGGFVRDNGYTVFEIRGNRVVAIEDIQALLDADQASKDLILVPAERAAAEAV